MSKQNRLQLAQKHDTRKQNRLQHRIDISRDIKANPKKYPFGAYQNICKEIGVN